MDTQYTFDSCEKQGRKLMKNFLQNFSGSDQISNIESTKGKYDKLDMTCSWGNSKIGFEIKVRDSRYVNESELLMEKSKYDHFVAQKVVGTMDFCYYSCFFDYDSPFGIIRSLYLFEQSDIREIGRPKIINCKDSTVNFSRYISKECIMLPIYKASAIYEYNFDTKTWEFKK